MSYLSNDFDASLSQINNEHVQKAFSNDSYSSPTKFNSTQSSSAYSTDSSSYDYSSYCSSCSSSGSDTSDSYYQETLYVCCIAYQPKIQGDLNLAFADRVKLIHMNDDFALVENIITRKCGYVPRYCISTMTQFLKEVKYLNNK